MKRLDRMDRMERIERVAADRLMLALAFFALALAAGTGVAWCYLAECAWGMVGFMLVAWALALVSLRFSGGFVELGRKWREDDLGRKAEIGKAESGKEEEEEDDGRQGTGDRGQKRKNGRDVSYRMDDDDGRSWGVRMLYDDDGKCVGTATVVGRTEP